MWLASHWFFFRARSRRSSRNWKSKKNFSQGHENEWIYENFTIRIISNSTFIFYQNYSRCAMHTKLDQKIIIYIFWNQIDHCEKLNFELAVGSSKRRSGNHQYKHLEKHYYNWCTRKTIRTWHFTKPTFFLSCQRIIRIQIKSFNGKNPTIYNTIRWFAG